MTPTKPQTIDERLNEHSKDIQMLKEVFVPMAKTAMEIIAGKNGQPGMAETLRGVREDLQELIGAYREDQNQTQVIRKEGFGRIAALEGWQKEQATQKEIKLMGMKVSAEAKIAIITGLFTLTGIVISRLAGP